MAKGSGGTRNYSNNPQALANRKTEFDSIRIQEITGTDILIRVEGILLFIKTIIMLLTLRRIKKEKVLRNYLSVDIEYI